MNTYGNILRISIFGESHGKLIGVVMDGIPAGIPICEDDFLKDLGRRKSGGFGTTPRIERDLPNIVSGVYEGRTTGAPLTVTFENGNTHSEDYSTFRQRPRPGHADFVAGVKYKGFNDIRGGGHFSGRMTLCLVAAGVVAKKIAGGITFTAGLTELGGIALPGGKCITSEDISEHFPEEWTDALNDASRAGDSIGGIIECKCKNVPVGLGEPFFNSIESGIAHLVFSVPATRGIEFGDGFAAAGMKGSEHNDCLADGEGHTQKNGAGGINGGISNGSPIVFRVAVKPTSSIAALQKSYDFSQDAVCEFSVPGRHDTCVALRCLPVIEAAAAITIADNLLMNNIFVKI
ncbi:MAG: chorismate synthase [Bacteroidales bacterium]|jgi:chorismate synthase|nr:chorismate synthase [Bacteroidales bacterium]